MPSSLNLLAQALFPGAQAWLSSPRATCCLAWENRKGTTQTAKDLFHVPRSAPLKQIMQLISSAGRFPMPRSKSIVAMQSRGGQEGDWEVRAQIQPGPVSPWALPGDLQEDVAVVWAEDL